MRDVINEQSEKLLAGSLDQYIVFQPVTLNDLTEIEARRYILGKCTRFTHYIDSKILVIKLTPSVTHEAAHRNFGKEIERKTELMGVSRHDLYSVGAGRFEVTGKTSKEGDSCYIPNTRRGSWPTLVVEAGLSETLPRLRVEADWWLGNSDGQVKIVVLLEINKTRKEIRIEQWEIQPPEPTTGRNLAQVATLMNEVFIDSNNVITGVPLKLDFRKVFLRPAVPPEEDIEIGSQELTEWAENLWLNT